VLVIVSVKAGKISAKQHISVGIAVIGDNIKMDLREVGGVGDWMELAQDRDRWRALVNTVMNLRVP